MKRLVIILTFLCSMNIFANDLLGTWITNHQLPSQNAYKRIMVQMDFSRITPCVSGPNSNLDNDNLMIITKKTIQFLQLQNSSSVVCKVDNGTVGYVFNQAENSILLEGESNAVKILKLNQRELILSE